jgi:hypothetical protein
MKLRIVGVLVAVALLATAGTTLAQQQTGEIFGRVTDASGAVLPGVTVTLSGPALLQPQTAVTGESGAYQFPRIPIGTYAVRFELPGFRSVVKEGIAVTIGFNAQVNAELGISQVEETITVTGESPIVDTRETGTKTSFDIETLQNIPSARDPWVMLERAPAITMDRVNVGGSQSGQQSGYISRGASTGNNKWSVDGVDITDMSATGASPFYYDFDMFEEMQVTTGGADASQQTGGVGINIVTRGGTDRFRGSGRFYVTDEEFQADNVNDELRSQGAGSGNPIQNIQDYGVEVGGPIMRGKLWYWGSYGKQDIKVGVLNFYKNTTTCRPAGVPVNQIAQRLDTDTLRSCLETDLTTLNNYNYKINWSPFANNRFAWQNTFAEKIRNARDASDTRPIETTYRQKGVSSAYGAWGWKTGPSSLWKASDQHIFSDRLMLDVQWAHVGNNFTLDFHDDSLYDVQRTFEITTSTYGRSFQQSIFVRPVNSLDVTTSYFLPNRMGGDHSFKAGFRWREAPTLSETHVGGNVEARFRNSAASEATLYRDAQTQYDLQTYGLYLQDNYTVKRFNVNVGVRWDRQTEKALPSSVPAHPFAPQWLPALEFAGADPEVVWNDISPRIGVTYDITGRGETLAKASFATYYGQLGVGQLASNINPVVAANIRFPWTDLNGDQFVQANELDYSRILNFSSGYDPNNPAALVSAGSVDPDVKNDRTREFIAGFDHQLTRDLAIGGSYIWRKYDRFQWDDILGLSSTDYVARAFTPAATACPAGADCPTVTYYEPAFPQPANEVYTNVPDRWRDFNGVELVLRKRMSNRWGATFSYAYNNAVDHWDSPAAYEDPTCRAALCAPEQQYAPESSGSGIDNIFTNAKWLVKLSGVYTLPLWDINLAGFYNHRQGYPFAPAIRTPSRANQAGTVDVLLDPLGTERFSSVYTIDFRVDKAFTVYRTTKLVPSLDIFNLSNENTILARRRLQNASNANVVSGIIAPRVIRFGVRVQW